MIFRETPLAGAVVLDPESHVDHRGSFTRAFCRREFASHGLNPDVAQCSLSYNRSRGTLRGMHYQAAPSEEAKLVRCVRGAVYDVIIDLRPRSPTYTQHFAVELTAENRRAIYIPEGFAHGFQSLEDDSEILYQMSEFYAPDRARGVRWDDPAFAIRWPIADPIILERDDTYPDFTPAAPV